MSLVHQCNSCETISKGSRTLGPDGYEAIPPSGWGSVTIEHNGGHKAAYDLCAECLSKPITFGNITWEHRVK